MRGAETDMSDDFFSKIDRVIEGQKQVDATAKATATENVEFAKIAFAEMKPIAETYKRSLVERDVSVQLQTNPTSLSFEMVFQDGDQHGLKVITEMTSGAIEFVGAFSENGKSYTSRGGERFTERNWKLSLFEDRLQKLISDYFQYAPKHRGTS